MASKRSRAKLQKLQSLQGGEAIYAKTADDDVIITQIPAQFHPRKRVSTGQALTNKKKIYLKKRIKVWKKLINIQKTTKANLIQPEIEKFYLIKVSTKSVCEVEALLHFSETDKRLQFNRDCCDLEEKTALDRAIDNRDKMMLQLLLKNKVEVGNSLYHAIEERYVEGVELILKFDSCVTSCITPGNHKFQIGLTPFSLAAITNNYSMLKILQEYGHELKTVLRWNDNFQQAWEFRAIRKFFWMARASPAYITWKCEILSRSGVDVKVMQDGMDLIESLRDEIENESELTLFYEGLCDQVEEFLCKLLDQVQSTMELSLLFDYDYLQLPQYKFGLFVEDSTRQPGIRIIERACELKMFRFVNHTNTQLAISHLLCRNTPFLQSRSNWKNFFLREIIGLLYPIWCIFYLIAPKSKLGKILKYPRISFECYMMSSISFLLLLILNVCTKSPENEYLGAPPTLLEIIVCFWVLGKWKEEYNELLSRGCASYISDWWNYHDLVLLVAFTATFIFRMIDYGIHKDDAVKIFVENWPHYGPRAISTGLLACVYVMAFIRILGLTRTNRVLGPLRITLARMLNDVIRFFVIFAVVMFAFGIGLSELYWYFGTEQGARLMCSASENATAACIKMSFTSIPNAMVNLFWGLFGYLELEKLEKTPSPVFIKFIGYILLGAFSVTVIIIMLNMLIAMMSNTFEAISHNEEKEWRFYRTVIWIRFIRGDFACPPPLNLLPNFYYFYGQTKYLLQQLKKKFCTPKINKLKQTNDPIENCTSRSFFLRQMEFVQHDLLERYKSSHFYKRS